MVTKEATIIMLIIGMAICAYLIIWRFKRNKILKDYLSQAEKDEMLANKIAIRKVQKEISECDFGEIIPSHLGLTFERAERENNSLEQIARDRQRISELNLKELDNERCSEKQTA